MKQLQVRTKVETEELKKCKSANTWTGTKNYMNWYMNNFIHHVSEIVAPTNVTLLVVGVNLGFALFSYL